MQTLKSIAVIVVVVGLVMVLFQVLENRGFRPVKRIADLFGGTAGDPNGGT